MPVSGDESLGRLGAFAGFSLDFSENQIAVLAKADRPQRRPGTPPVPDLDLDGLAGTAANDERLAPAPINARIDRAGAGRQRDLQQIVACKLPNAGPVDPQLVGPQPIGILGCTNKSDGAGIRIGHDSISGMVMFLRKLRRRIAHASCRTSSASAR